MFCNYIKFQFQFVVWIASVLSPKSSGQRYLTKLIGAIESYLHPANVGKWINAISEIIVQLPKYLFDRLIMERYKPHTWKKPVPGKCHDVCLAVLDFINNEMPYQRNNQISLSCVNIMHPMNSCKLNSDCTFV